MFEEVNNDFKKVKHNSRRKAKLKVNKSKETVEIYSVDEIIEKVNLAVQKLKDSPFYPVVKTEIERALNYLHSSCIVDIICYGIGNFSEHICSKFQLATLLALKSLYSSNVYIYDPLFTKNEIESLKRLNLQVIEKNEEGKRTINNHLTLVYMPHCSKQLLNNFLLTNWTPVIHNCILLGNSWSEVECNTTDALLKQNAISIYKLKPFVTEIKLKNNFQYPNTFSGTSLHIFTKEKLEKLDPDFWKDRPENLCVDNDPELIKCTP